MNRTIASQGFLFALTALLAAACTQTPKEAPKATATPAAAAAAAATPMAQAAPAQAAVAADELYVDLEGDPDEGTPPLTVKWTSTVEDGTPPYTYKWDFGDGTPASTEANPSHIYAKEGEFTATLSVSDSKGLTGSEEYDILVEKEEE
ncbi:MAG: PKD domain-containing protein [Candidatus Binatia bacterium]